MNLVFQAPEGQKLSDPQNKEAIQQVVDQITNERGPESAFLGSALGPVGYGTLLIVGEAAQITVTQL